MNQILVKIYSLFPPSTRNWLGQRKALKSLRDHFLKQDGFYKEGEVRINRKYLNHSSSFWFYASIKNAAKAKKSGIEGTVLHNSFQLIDQYKTHTNDLIIFDVGANFGFLSLTWATTVCKQNGKVYAFEPNKIVGATFQKSIRKNQLEDGIILQSMAVGRENKQIKLYIKNTTSNVLDDPESLPFDEVEMTTLDRFFDVHQLSRCDLIKIDVDGIELDILKGSLGIIEQCAPIFIVETNNDQRIIDFFKALPYEILDMDLKPYIPKTLLPANIFCVPKSDS